MKKISKLLCIVLCLSMLMGFALVASAEDAAATLSFADTSARTLQNDEQQVWEANGIKLINDRNGGYSAIKDYSNPARFYKSTKLTIEYTGMTKLVAVCPSQAYAQVWVDSNTDSNATVTIAAEDGTSNFVATVVFTAPTNSFVLETLAAQTRVSELTVYGAGGQAPEQPEIPEQPEQPEEPETPADVAIADGDYVLYVPAYNKALSSVYGGFYNNGVDVTAANGELSGYGATEIWTVANNDDGTISISFGGQKLGMADEFSSMTLGETHDKWVVTDAGNGLVYVMNTVREAYIEWYDSKNYWSAYHTIAAGSEGMFALAFYSLAEPEIPEIPETPENPETPEDPEITIVDVKTALDADSGSFTVKGVVTLIDGKNLYVQDATGAICVRMIEDVAGVSVGDTVIAGGSRSDYFGAPQLGNGSFEKSEGVELVAKETTIDALTRADLYTYVKLSGLTITDIFDNDGAYTVPNITVTDGTNEIQIYKAVIDKNEDGTWEFAVGDKIDVLAAVGCYNETLQLRNTVSDEITAFVADSEDNIEDDNQDNTEDDAEDNTEDIPQTSDASIVAAALVATCAALGLVVLTKKEQF